ncbi:MAG: hypothetical protein M3O22_02185 [Pseudomonadota bacterium]|nr:hypothetical protein [Pseudomonadota bacterium]
MFPERYIIEVNDEAVGLVIGDPERQGLVFHAIHPRLGSIQGQRFPTPHRATRTATSIMGTRHRSGR